MNQSDQTPAPVRLTNVFAEDIRLDPHDPGHVYIKLPSYVYDYFFRHVLAGCHGTQQAIGSTIFKALYDHLTQTIGLPKCYDPDNINIIARELSKLNFEERQLPSDNRTTPKRRRAAGGAPVAPGKSKPADGK